MTGDMVMAAKFIGAGLAMIGAAGRRGGDRFERAGRVGRHGAQPGCLRQPADQHDPGDRFLRSYRDLLPGDRVLDAVCALDPCKGVRLGKTRT